MRVSIIIPVFNERKALASVLDEVLAETSSLDVEIVAVDDGSTDGSALVLDAYAEAAPVMRVVRHPRNLGKAAAIRTGLARATGAVILVQDADLEYSPRDYGRILAPFKDERVQAVYGSRFLHARWPARMKVANWLANKVFVAATNLLYGSSLTDQGTGFKVIRREILQSVGISSSRFEFCPEVTAGLLKKGISIVEVPVSYAARDRKDGKKPGFRDGLSVLWTIVKCRFTG